MRLTSGAGSAPGTGLLRGLPRDMLRRGEQRNHSRSQGAACLAAKRRVHGPAVTDTLAALLPLSRAQRGGCLNTTVERVKYGEA
jgi:hypothetical protein